MFKKDGSRFPGSTSSSMNSKTISVGRYRLLTNAKQMQKWCVKRKLLPANVLVEIYAQEDFQLDDGDKEARVLSDEEIRLKPDGDSLSAATSTSNS